ncbi:serine/threonine-protein kinase [uncultured Nevskia sp.]|uniref:serine/threonine protein kinase n=1 Tax=uncultured Nevskia sp. TaxID=228950 RepID=UPI0025E19BA9|nr:serine/threonine-protein kinase [uncultured Nevskia sp.]
MTDDRAIRLQALFDEASLLPWDQRGEFLDRVCAGDIALRLDLERQLRNVGDTVVVLDRSAVTDETEAPPEPLQAGTLLGPWEIERLVGQGGMGEVYQARRADQAFELRVAIKLLKRGLDTHQVIRRFLLERRILAQLTHPNIAHALDAGAAPDGRPYLVMEYVEGQAITEYARTGTNGLALSITEMLRLMIVVCQAVQEAHKRQIVHRDLKPSNVLVTAEGQVKLLDFGIAKSLSEEEVDATRMAGEATALTPAYAAPEQILGQAITPATDVYALGVMLYELLTARLPHRREGRSASVIVVELDKETVLRPSIVLRQERGRLPEPERASRLREVSKDLDLIALKALHPDTTRRYADAEALGDDLQRLLDQRPILARPDSLAYSANRFVRRNRLVVAAATAVMVALTAGLSIAIWQAGIARTEARSALLQKQRAEQVKEFMLSVFKEQDPYEHTRQQQRTPLQLIVEAAKRVDTDLSGDPEIHAEVLVELAGIRVNLGDVAGAREMLERALAQQKSIYGSDSLPVARSLIELARAADKEKGDGSAEIEPNAREALRILVLPGQGDRRALADAKLLLGRALGFSRASTTEALNVLEEARQIDEAIDGKDSRAAVNVLLAEMAVLRRASRVAEAETAAREAIARLERIAGPENIRLAYPLSELGSLLTELSRYSEAIPALQRSIAIRRKELGDKAPGLAINLAFLGQAYASLNRFDEAEIAFIEGESAVSEHDEATLYYFLFQRLTFEQNAERWPEAEADARRVFALSRKLYGDEYPYTWWAASSLGYALASRGQYSSAEKILTEARSRMEAIVGADAYDNAFPASMLGIERLLSGRPEEALEPLRSALALTEAVFNRTTTTWATNALNLAEALLQIDTTAASSEAKGLIDQALLVFQSSSEPVFLAKALIDRGLWQINNGNNSSGVRDMTEADKLLKNNFGNHDIDLARIQRALKRK